MQVLAASPAFRLDVSGFAFAHASRRAARPARPGRRSRPARTYSRWPRGNAGSGPDRRPRSLAGHRFAASKWADRPLPFRSVTSRCRR
jgi:hypothetical protein